MIGRTSQFEDAPLPPSSGDGSAPRSSGPPSAETPLGSPFAFGVTVVSIGFLAAGIFWPQGAGALLRMLVAAVALGYVGSRLYRAGLPERTTHDTYSPFDGQGGALRPTMPGAIRSLAAQLEAADDVSAASTTPIPWPIALSLIEEASRRLDERHGLRLEDPAHHPSIRRLLSEPTWLLIDPGRGEMDGAPAATVEYRAVPTSRLAAILDDLETL